MITGADTVASFYQARRGEIASVLVRDLVAAHWPDLRGLRVVGLGHAWPYVELWPDAACRACLGWSRPAESGASPLPASPRGPLPGAEIDPGSLPLADRSVDRILLVHGLELAGDQRRLLRECWRVLADGGRLLALVPNRAGVWAHAERTPFGDGRPYSAGQLSRLLTDCLFQPERRAGGLFMPPFGPAPSLALARRMERTGRAVAPGLSGLLLAEAVKDQYAAIPAVALRAPGRGRVARAAMHAA